MKNFTKISITMYSTKLFHYQRIANNGLKLDLKKKKTQFEFNSPIERSFPINEFKYPGEEIGETNF